MRLVSLFLVLLLATAEAYAQGSMVQAGSYTAGHVPMYSVGGQGQPTMIDSGPAGGGAVGVGLSELLVTARGSGSAPYAGQGSGPSGTNICSYDAPINNSTGYHYLCLSANAEGGGLITYGAGGGASALPLNVMVNGVLEPIGSGSGITALTGDVTASGAGSVAASVVRLQGRNMASTAPTNGQVLAWNAGGSQWQPTTLGAGTGTVTSVTAGTGLSGGTITSTGTIGLANTAVTPGSYGSSTNVAQFTVDQQGRITAVSNVAISAGGVGTVTSVGTGTGLTGGPITGSGTISLANTVVTPGTYGNSTNIPQITIDQQGRITSAANISLPSSGVNGPGASTVGNVATWNNTAGTLLANTVPGALSITATGSTTARTLAARAAAVFDVKDYGAVCDGVTDDVVAIQAAVTAASVAGGTVQFPSGTCISSGTITTAGHAVTLQGHGPFVSVLSCSGTGTGDCIVIGRQAGAIFYNNIFDLGVTAAARTGGNCLAIDKTSNTVVNNFYAFNCFNGVLVQKAITTMVSHFNITGIDGTYGIKYNGTTTLADISDILKLEAGLIQASWVGKGIEWDGGAYRLYLNDVNIQATTYGIDVTNAGGSATLFPAYLFASNLMIDGAKNVGVRIGAGFNFVIGNSFINNLHGDPSQGSADTNCMEINPDTGISETRSIFVSNTSLNLCGTRAVLANAQNIQLSNISARSVSMASAAPIVEFGAAAADGQISNLNTYTTGDAIAATYAVLVNNSASRIQICGVDGRGTATGLYSFGTNTSVQTCNGIYASGAVAGISMGGEPNSTYQITSLVTSGGAARGFYVKNNSTTVGTSARSLYETGTVNAFTVLEQVQDTGPIQYGRLITGAGNDFGFIIDTTAAAAAPITLAPGSSAKVDIVGRVAATSYQAVALLMSNTAPTIASGFGTGPSVVSHNGTAAFRVNVGTGGVATSGVVTLPTASAGWSCAANNITTTNGTTFLTKQTANSTTSATFGNFDAAGASAAWAASDVLFIQCMAF